VLWTAVSQCGQGPRPNHPVVPPVLPVHYLSATINGADVLSTAIVCRAVCPDLLDKISIENPPSLTQIRPLMIWVCSANISWSVCCGSSLKGEADRAGDDAAGNRGSTFRTGADGRLKRCHRFSKCHPRASAQRWPTSVIPQPTRPPHRVHSEYSHTAPSSSPFVSLSPAYSR
jgi:hypothetical protein